MRQVTFNESISEIEIHPPETYTTFQRLAERSYSKMDRSKFIDMNYCPACGSTKISEAFTIWYACYYECNDCDSLFVKERPNPTQLSWYIEESETAVYRKSAAYLAAMQANYAKLSSYRASWISSATLRIPMDQELKIADLETRSSALIESIQQQIQADIVTVQPFFSEASNVKTVDALSEIKDESVTILTAFDIFEHQYSPQHFIQEISRKVMPGGFFLLTTRAGSGFDIQILRGDCPTIVPIEHLNLLSVEGIKTLLSTAGFEILEISTPGQLDVQIVEQVMNKPEHHSIPKAIQYFLKNRDQYAKQNLQQFLQTNLLSSHLRLVAQKKDLR